MAHAYTPGLKVSSHTRYACRRILPVAGNVLVDVGDSVQATQIVAEAHLPGDITPVNMANLLSVPPGDVPDCMLKQPGDEVAVGDVLARTPGIFGLFKKTELAKVAGTIESVSTVTGQLIMRGAPQPVQVSAYISGSVVEVLPNQGVVVESDVSLVQGIFGVGGESHGEIRLACEGPDQPLTDNAITDDMKGCIVVGGARMTGESVRRAIEVGCNAVISGGMDDQDLKDILGYDLGVAITGSEKIGLTIVITEGFGDIAMAERTYRLFESHKGREASVNGTTQIRAGVMRPEIVIPLPQDAPPPGTDEQLMTGFLDLGTVVRIIRDPYFGVIGKVSGLPAETQELGSGSRARVLNVDLSAGETVTVPRANVEIIGA